MTPEPTQDPDVDPIRPAAPSREGEPTEPERPELAPGVLEAALAHRPTAVDGAETASESVLAEPPVVSERPVASGDTEHASEPDATAPLTVDLADPDAEALGVIPLATRIEALLFAATEPIPLKRLRELTACPDAKAVREAIETLSRDYTESRRAFRIEEIVQGFQLRTTDAVGPVVARLGRRPTDDRISTAALETLAVVAYRQPVLRADVEKIRGVACGEVLRALQERGLVRIVGRADFPGSPLLYGTTQRFLEIFGLRDLQELPKDRDLLRPRP